MDKKALLSATFEMYKDCAFDATQSLLRNLPILPASIAAYVIFRFAFTLFSRFGMGGGFLLGLINVVLLSYYYGWLNECVRKNKLSLNDYLSFDYGLFSAVINAAFVLFIATFVLGSMTAGLNVSWLVACATLGLFIFFNCLPEIVYLHGYTGLTAFSEAFRFVRDNWIEWFFPLLVFFIPLLIQSPIAVLLMFSAGEPLLPVLSFIRIFSMGALFLSNEAFSSTGIFEIALTVISLTVATWFMIFRGFLFIALESGSRRQRAFRASQE